MATSQKVHPYVVSLFLRALVLWALVLGAARAAAQETDAGQNEPDADASVPRTSKVTFVLATESVSDLSVTFDDRDVPLESLTRWFSIAPGKHVVRARATVRGLPHTFEREIEVDDGQAATVRIDLALQGHMPCCVTDPACVRAAKTEAEVARCMEDTRRGSVTTRAGGCGSCSVGAPTETPAVALVSVAASLLVGCAIRGRGARIARRAAAGAVTANEPAGRGASRDQRAAVTAGRP